MTYGFIRQFIAEGRPASLTIEALPYGKDELSPAISKATLDYHYEHLAKTYAKRYNAGEGDPVFNEAGVFLHNILFQQYRESTGNKNKPEGKVLELIETHYKTFEKFKDEFEKVAMGIQEWLGLSCQGWQD